MSDSGSSPCPRRTPSANLVLVAFCLVACCLPVASVYAQLPELIGEIPADTFAIDTQWGRRIEPMGDQNGDGCDDILLARRDFVVFFYYGSAAPIDTLPELRFDSLGSRLSNLGRVNGDSFDDFAAFDRAKHRLNVFYGGPSMDTTPDLWFRDDTAYAVGYSFLGEDIDRNGEDELISWNANDKALLFYDIDSSVDTLFDLYLRPANTAPGSWTFGTAYTTGDFNGDSIIDLAVGMPTSAEGGVKGAVWLYWGGPAFDTLPDLILHQPGEYIPGHRRFGDIVERIGDFNGDGYEDLVAGCGVAWDDTLNFVFFGGPDIDTTADITFDRKTTSFRAAGDVNNDGHPDIISSYPTPYSGSGTVHVYYGGPDCDSIPDIVIENGDMPEYQTYFGLDCSGVGDFNGDGLDDFAFSSLTSYGGKVYIFSGTDESSVGDDYMSELPSSFALSQNYPNPFNPTTTIEFTLPVRSRVRMTIHNVLGQLILVLIDDELRAGRHRIEWKGTDSSGVHVASGVYLCRLQSGEESAVRKMLLLR